MPPAAPVTIAVRCCSLTLQSFYNGLPPDRNVRAADKGHRRREPADHRRHFLGLPDLLERIAWDPLGTLQVAATALTLGRTEARSQDAGQQDSVPFTLCGAAAGTSRPSEARVG